ncbi:hypothetical protein GE09DRAFT_1066620 [Coniochaeta sp. 2T2.1]|nr:hypothetical protein GE09DRAFT_1066620 [Coniochaeta sp. 2T2.1]
MMYSTKIFGLVASLVMLTNATPAAARTWAGPVHMDAACQEQNSGEWWQAIRSGNGANDWYCYNPRDGKTTPVDVGRFCRVTYGGNAYADPQGGGAFDWGCYYP